MANKHEKWGQTRQKGMQIITMRHHQLFPRKSRMKFDEDEKTFLPMDRGSNWQTTLENVC